MAERNYPCDNLIDVYFGGKGEDYFNVSQANFKAQLYQCQLSQALYMKSNIETRRAQNQLGHLVWQYNEIWPTGGWGSIEYGSPRPGQVLGGRWKPLQYFYRRSIFADVMATCGDGGACYVRNDRAGRPFEGSCMVASLDFATGASKTVHTLDLTGKSARAGRRRPRFFPVDLSAVDASTHMLTASCAPVAADAVTASFVRAGAVGASGADASLNEILLAPPAALTLPPAAIPRRWRKRRTPRHRRRDAEGERHRALRDADDGGAGALYRQRLRRHRGGGADRQVRPLRRLRQGRARAHAARRAPGGRL